MKESIEKFIDRMWNSRNPEKKVSRRIELVTIILFSILGLYVLLSGAWPVFIIQIPFLAFMVITSGQSLLIEEIMDAYRLSNTHAGEVWNMINESFPVLPEHVKEKSQNMIDRQTKEFTELIKKY